MAKQSYFSRTVLIQAIQFSTSIVFVYTLLNVKTTLFKTIQFYISTQYRYDPIRCYHFGPEWTWER